ncbi:MAG: SDR family NAD(P)-dependent oxidoreductase [Verrucomicrobia bacterium]|nr:SDR family NAD(P)-dependent oxidoreductase [Verrucomicrobiota bacterium]
MASSAKTKPRARVETSRRARAFRLDGETALITGGATGLGFGIARCMVEAGARVVLVGRREAELRKATAALNGHAVYLAHDVTELKRADELVQAAEKAIKAPLSILVNNAGIHLKKAAIDTTTEEFQSVLQTHVLAAHALSRAVLPGMIARKHGNILFTASMASLFGIPLVVAYSAAKSAYLGMVRTLAVELSGRGIRVNAIAPGWIDSIMMRQTLEKDPARSRKILDRTPLGRFGEADDVGWAAVYLGSPAAQFVTGVVLPVDGGANIGF